MSEFVAYLHEVFATFGPITAKRMFGGHGIYHNGLMIGLVADDTLYLKADTESRPLFEARGLHAFEYIKNGKAMQMSYLTAPEDIFDDPDDATLWAERAYQAALRADSSKARKRKLTP
jgi:DNA transformation protein